MNPGLQKLKNCGIIKKLICTDSHVNTGLLVDDEFVDIRSLDELICTTLG
ncbi:hypothetical protein KXD93_28205 [Mucilaginibacter sp. BJC16-A38]|nr:hypothetical protein [Mucilaginibacter phenanthrenivorans]MCR8561571.1 hypothetical protein [Mucilaginibacter phenanthrenivorans]